MVVMFISWYILGKILYVTTKAFCYANIFACSFVPLWRDSCGECTVAWVLVKRKGGG